MPGYQRFVTYMFRYKDEKKQENCGFAKIEIRQGHCRVQIQITGMKGSEAEVYFLSKDAYVPVGIYLGKLRIQEGIARQFFLCDADHVGETAHSMQEMRGLYICQQEEPGRFVASQWDDVGTVWRNLKLQKGTESEAENRAEEDFVENDVEKEEMTDQMDPIGGQKEADTEKADTEEEDKETLGNLRRNRKSVTGTSCNPDGRGDIHTGRKPGCVISEKSTVSADTGEEPLSGGRCLGKAVGMFLCSTSVMLSF